MPVVQTYLVSTSGQVSLPAAARHRWGLDSGGPLEVVDLGDAVLMLPAGGARRLLRDLVPTAEEHAAFIDSLADDPDLATT